MTKILEVIADHLQSEYGIKCAYSYDQFCNIELYEGVLCLEMRSDVLLLSLITDNIMGGRTEWIRRFELADPDGLKQAINSIIKTVKEDKWNFHILPYRFAIRNKDV